MVKKVFPGWINKVPYLLILLFSVTISCGLRPNPAGDDMKIVQNGKIFSVRLDDKECLTFSIPVLAGCSDPQVKIDTPENDWRHISMKWTVTEETEQDELSVPFDVTIKPDFWWAPHLAPEEGYVVGQHVFRSPAMIVVSGNTVCTVVPDLDVVGKLKDNPFFMDYDAEQNNMWLGMVKTEIPKHVLFRKIKGMKFEPGQCEISFYFSIYRDDNPIVNPWRNVSGFLWNRYAEPLYKQGEPVHAPLADYVKHTYNWAFNSWAQSVWQEFDLNGVRVGAPQFIVNISQSPNYPGIWYQREFLSIWNQAWFSSLRSASGLFRYAKKIKNEELLRKARLTKELALAAPMNNGIFPSVIRIDNTEVKINGKSYRRPQGWEHGYWSNSNRSPRNYGITGQWYHILDESWTALLMLRWYEELEKDERLIQYVKKYAETLLTLQDSQGFFPGWLHPETFEPGPVMNWTPESSLSVTFLLKIAELTGEEKFRTAALKAIEAVLKEIVPDGRWEDFETYWSCCGWGRDMYLGKKIERNDMYKQNSFSMFWTAEALLAAYKATGKKEYFAWGERTLNELSMCQQVWQPPYIYVPALGGFGVMNADGEWNDSRQTLFAELFLDYYRESGNPEYFHRGIAALKSGFIMMYCPENETVKKMWEKVYPWFSEEDYGFMMENYAHGGRTSPEGEGMGAFTIYDWGNGAAAEAAMRIHDHYGDVYIDRARKQAFGIDKVNVISSGDGWTLKNTTGIPQNVRIVFENGDVQEKYITGSVVISH